MVRALLRNRAVQWAGLASYGIYLWHDMLMTKVLEWRHLQLFRIHFPYLFGVVTAVTLVASAVTYAVVERPFLRLKSRRLLARREREARPPMLAPTLPQ